MKNIVGLILLIDIFALFSYGQYTLSRNARFVYKDNYKIYQEVKNGDILIFLENNGKIIKAKD
ncbi:MAG: hypothetical protein N2505_05945, partial [Endomicrobia bacterium]|nr:hypothetical protein [Endomicrobiia bacterium]